MSDLHTIKRRIDSVGDTRKITNAMYLISSAKMRKAKADLDRTRPYFEATRTEIKRIFRSGELPESRYMYPLDENEKPEGTFACLLITGDKGLAGAYNYNVIKKAEELHSYGCPIAWYVVGEYGRHLLTQRGVNIERSFASCFWQRACCRFRAGLPGRGSLQCRKSPQCRGRKRCWRRRWIWGR